MISKVVSNVIKGCFPLYVDEEGVYACAGRKIFKILHRNNKMQEIARIRFNPIKDVIANFNLFRRLMRFHISNFIVLKDKNIVIFFGNDVFALPYGSRNIKKTYTFRRGRRLIFHSICYLENNKILVGEYWDNPQREAVRIWKSCDGGFLWNVAYEFKRNTIRHIHAVLADPFTNNIWIMSGDYGNEPGIVITDETFRALDYVGRGSQLFRATNLIFNEDYVVWGTDSDIEDNFIVRYHRKSKKIEKVHKLIGPCFSSQKTKEGLYFIATGSELRKSLFARQKVAIYASIDLSKWKKIIEFDKDIYSNRYFQYGFIIFPNGNMSKDSICLGGLGLKYIDNCTIYLDHEKISSILENS